MRVEGCRLPGSSVLWYAPMSGGCWCVDPGDNLVRWRVSMITENGWYWYTADYAGNRFSSMVGPFTSKAAAMADCETVHK